MPEYKVVELSQLREGRGRVAWAGTTKVAVFLLERRVYALKNHCPHAGGSLGTGQVRGRLVYCPRHAWGFNLQTGACPTNPLFCAQTYEVQIRSGWVWVSVPES